MKNKLMQAFLLVLVGAVLGATVMREPLGRSAAHMSGVASKSWTSGGPGQEMKAHASWIKGHEQRVETDAPAYALSLLAQAPVGNGQIAFDRPDLSSPGDGFAYTANADGSHAQRLTPTHGCCASWSPDGRRLTVSASTNDGRITSAIVRPDGSGYTRLPIHEPSLNVACAAWAPDGAHCAGEGWDDSNPSRNGIYRITLADATLVRLTSSPLGGHDVPGDYSPDGTKLVFGRHAQNGDRGDLFIVNADGTGLRQLTPSGTLIQPGNDGDWSPQGDVIVFSRHVSADVRGSLWTINADRSGLREIPVHGLGCGTVDRGCHSPHWSPDGTRIIFASNSAIATNVYTVNPDGTDLKAITVGDGPTWGTHPDIACTRAETLQRKKALATFKRTMKARRRAYFRKHHRARARHLFVKGEQTKLRKLETLAAACANSQASAAVGRRRST